MIPAGAFQGLQRQATSGGETFGCLLQWRTEYDANYVQIRVPIMRTAKVLSNDAVVTIDGSEYEIVAAESSFAADMRAYRLRTK